MSVQSLLAAILILLGVGFLVATVRLLIDYARFVRLRRHALLVWPGKRPPYYGTALGIAAVLGLLLFYKLIFLRLPPRQVFGEGMMFLYYAYALPLSWRIRRGFYEDGIWSDSRFIRYDEVGGIRWREGKAAITLIVVARLKDIARRLSVPTDQYGAARRVLRDKIADHAIHLEEGGLGLGGQDGREEV